MKGLRLADGREVVVKVRPGMPRLAGCAVVHRALWTAGFPCPEPLVDLQPLEGYAATGEALVPDAGRPPPENDLAREMPGWLRVSPEDLASDDDLSGGVSSGVGHARSLPPRQPAKNKPKK